MVELESGVHSGDDMSSLDQYHSSSGCDIDMTDKDIKLDSDNQAAEVGIVEVGVMWLTTSLGCVHK